MNQRKLKYLEYRLDEIVNKKIEEFNKIIPKVEPLSEEEKIKMLLDGKFTWDKEGLETAKVSGYMHWQELFDFSEHDERAKAIAENNIRIEKFSEDINNVSQNYKDMIMFSKTEADATKLIEEFRNMKINNGSALSEIN